MSREKRVFLAGEGRNELGSRSGDPAYQTDDEPGVIVTLLRKVCPKDWSVGGARGWSSSKSYVAMPRSTRARGRAKLRVDHEDTRIVLVAANDAADAGCDVLAFLRDVDNDHDRETAIVRGLETAAELVPEVAAIGAAVVPLLEGWVLAAMGVRGTESLSPASAVRRLEENGIPQKETASFVRVIDEADLAALPPDATRMRAWCERAREVLNAD